MLDLSRRINWYTIQHPWRAAAAGFTSFVLLSGLLLLILHRNFFGGLLGAYAVIVGSATGWSATRRGGRHPFWQKALVLPLMAGGWLMLGLLLQVAGLLPR